MKQCQILLAAVLLAACADSPVDPGHPVVPRDSIRNLTVTEQQVASASNQFALNLLASADASEKSKPNIMISPLSASMALGMTLNGAANATFDSMRSTLGLGSMTKSQANIAYAGLMRQLYARAGTNVQFALTNSVWYDKNFTPLPSFVDTLKYYFDAATAALDFRSATAPQTISQWAADKTNGRIKDLMKSIDPAEVMFLVNAVYFKAPWTKAFDPKKTYSGQFTKADGSRVSVPMMSREGTYLALNNSSVTAVELPYADSAYTILLWMPKGTARWTLPTGLSSAGMILNLPKFHIEYELELKDILSAMGMAIAFDDQRADFSRIAGTHNLYITRVFQKTFIDVNEEGTEAAAATNVGIGLVSLPQSITFDKPFLYAIREKSSGTILFAGRVNDPSGQ